MAENTTENDAQQIDICEEARDRFRAGMNAESDLRQAFLERMKYRAGEQWDEQEKQARGVNRPAIVVNLLEQPIQQVINQNLLNKPGGQVSPADEAGNDDVAEFLQGRIRHIEYVSNSNVAYGTAV